MACCCDGVGELQERLDRQLDRRKEQMQFTFPTCLGKMHVEKRDKPSGHVHGREENHVGDVG